MKRVTLFPGREIQKESSFRPTASDGELGGYPLMAETPEGMFRLSYPRGY